MHPTTIPIIPKIIAIIIKIIAMDILQDMLSFPH